MEDLPPLICSVAVCVTNADRNASKSCDISCGITGMLARQSLRSLPQDASPRPFGSLAKSTYKHTNTHAHTRTRTQSQSASRRFATPPSDLTRSPPTHTCARTHPPHTNSRTRAHTHTRTLTHSHSHTTHTHARTHTHKNLQHLNRDQLPGLSMYTHTRTRTHRHRHRHRNRHRHTALRS